MRGGRSPWFKPVHHPRPLDCSENLHCDALIVGGGITGSLIAERLTRQGLDVILIDRELPGNGSTVASTAMLLWEIDRSLTELTQLYGFERACRAYRASLDAVTGLKSLVIQNGIACEMRDRKSLYLAAGDSDRQMREEHRLRDHAGLPCDFLDHPALLEGFGIARAAALLSSGAAEADPVQLSRGLLKVAIGRGARVFEGEAVDYDASSRAVCVALDNGRQIEARSVILATGYVMPSMVHSTIQTVSSSWAIATRPQPQKLWNGSVLIWEDSKDYLYARTTTSGRIIIGGEDSEDVIEPSARDRLIPEKARRLSEKLAALWPIADRDIEFSWAGTFDTTSDGLPLIGPVPGLSGVYAAYGYGGNGITFSFLAAQLIGDLIAGSSSPLLCDFALDRDGGSARP